MGWVGLLLGVATSMFPGMTLGIGVDYAIHLLERQRRTRESGLDTEASLRDAVAATGPAICIDAIAVALGFGVLTLSQVPANARLGGPVVLSKLVLCQARRPGVDRLGGTGGTWGDAMVIQAKSVK